MTHRAGTSIPSPPPAHADPRVDAALAGDRAAAQAILEELLPKIRNLARFLLRSDHDVDDVAQVACIEILRGLGSWRGEAALEGWALRIAARVARRHGKRTSRDHTRREEAAPELRAVREPGEAPDAYLRRRDLARLLDQLPDKQREVLVLHHVMGMTLPEISTELGIPFETARSRLRHGMSALRERFAKNGGSR